MMKFFAAFLCMFLAGIQQSHGRTYPVPLPTPHMPSHVVLPGMESSSIGFGNNGNALPVMPRIVGGTEAEKHEFPWVAMLGLRYNGTYVPSCSATVINKWWIMTSAQCSQAYGYMIVAGEHNRIEHEGQEQQREIETIIIHPEWNVNSTLQNNIALIKLTEPLKLDGKTVSPISLPHPQANFSGDCVVTGWGRTEKGEVFGSDVLMKVTLPIITDKECRDNYEEVGLDVIDSMMCAGYSKGGKNTCLGDAGGSLVCQGADNKPYVAGVGSWIGGCGRPGFPSVYTEVSYFVDWINENITPK